MKLNFGKRLVLFLHWLLSLVACAYAVMQCVWPQLVEAVYAFFHSLIGVGSTKIVGIVLLALYVILSICTVIMVFSGNAKGKRSERGFITVDSSESGRTRIAVGAVDQMIRQAVRSVEGITDMKSGIVNHQDSISINCRVGVASGVHVPTITMNIQRAIRSYIELNCGVAVREVSVSVQSMENTEGKGRKKGKGSFTPAPAAAPAYTPVPVTESKPEPEIAAEPEAEKLPELEIEVPEAELPEIKPITLTLEVPEEMAEAMEEAEEPASEE